MIFRQLFPLMDVTIFDNLRRNTIRTSRHKLITTAIISTFLALYLEHYRIFRNANDTLFRIR
jgi:hypothetical protein